MNIRLILKVIFISFVFCPYMLWGGNFIVVIDPGHGGKDPGAVGAVLKEKDINLRIALALGALIEEKHPDVKVLYTRKKDYFVELDQRANIANKANADLFISIHTNAIANKNFTGTESFTLGLARTQENLAVAMRENSAILLEDDYKQKYAGFDPHSTESYIMFEFMQNKYMEQSISFADQIQKEFKSFARRNDRGVKQAGFLVLRKTSMPSVLIEVGFISNKEEERYMGSERGLKNLSESIYRAFKSYKSNHDRKSGYASERPMEAPEKKATVAPEKKTAAIPEQKAAPEQTEQKKTASVLPESDKEVYKVQILTSSVKLSANSPLLKNYREIDFYKENDLYKYTLGSCENLEDAKKIRNKVSKDFRDAFIITFKNGIRVK
ncbi:MAG: N-acetylmuramoyl-L-alanine amidase [Dysgonamonadaceae bacterium]|nr:N-acetylmuramoyl-L-alanine amidase [Dysgonamonadaceae bacterium]